MKLRDKKRNECSSGTFNMGGISEIIVAFDDFTVDSMDLHDFDVLLPDGTWKDLAQAFKDRDVIPDNYNTRFNYPYDDASKARGWNP